MWLSNKRKEGRDVGEGDGTHGVVDEGEEDGDVGEDAAGDDEEVEGDEELASAGGQPGGDYQYSLFLSLKFQVRFLIICQLYLMYKLWLWPWKGGFTV